MFLLYICSFIDICLCLLCTICYVLIITSVNLFTRFASFCFTGAKMMFTIVCKYVSVVVLFLNLV